MKLVSLLPHPSFDDSITRGFKVFAGAHFNANSLHLKFSITGESKEKFSEIEIESSQGDPERKDELWKKLCFECFIPIEGMPAYLEFNGSASGDWNWYSFTQYREGMKPLFLHANSIPKQIFSQTGPTQFETEWLLPLSGIGEGLVSSGVLAHGSSEDKIKAMIGNIGLTVVLKSINNGVTYWAVKHAGVKPDFHLKESFVYDSIRN